MHFFRLAISVLGIVLIYSCNKSTSNNSQLTDDAKITINEHEDTLYTSLQGFVEISGTITGSLDDYSILTVNALDEAGNILGTANVEGRTFVIIIDSGIEPGRYKVKVVAVHPDDASRNLTSSTILNVVVCYPPPTAISPTLSANTSIIKFTWRKALTLDFMKYEVFVQREDSLDMPARLLATINNINDTSAADPSVYLPYKYYYTVRTVSTGECTSDSKPFSSIAGRSIDLWEGSDILNSQMDPVSEAIYFMKPNGSSGTQLVRINSSNLFTGNDENLFYTYNYGANAYMGAMMIYDSELQIVQADDVQGYRFQSYDLGSGQNTPYQTNAVLPSSHDKVIGVFDRYYVLYTGHEDGEDYVAILENFDNTTNTVVYRGDILSVTPLFEHQQFVITTLQDSFFVYTTNIGKATLFREGKVPGLSSMPVRNVFHNSIRASIGNALFSYPSFTYMASLPAGQYFTAFSYNQYCLNNKNEILSADDLKLVHKFGDGFGTAAYFTMFDGLLIFTENTNGTKKIPQAIYYFWRN